MSLGRRVERLEDRRRRRTLTTAQHERQQREHDHLDREIESLAAELEAREGPGAVARIFAQVEAEYRGLGT